MYFHKEQRAMSSETDNHDTKLEPQTHTEAVIKKPINETNTQALPSAVTFYMSVQERRQLLNALKPIAHNRTQAILIAMGLMKNIEETKENKAGQSHG